LESHLGARGVGVVVRARHHCMGCRGVRKPGAEMVTSALSGYMKDDEKARAEFLALAHR
jgi:GTP cyclohydrolase I